MGKAQTIGKLDGRSSNKAATTPRPKGKGGSCYRSGRKESWRENQSERRNDLDQMTQAAEGNPTEREPAKYFLRRSK